MAISSFPVLFGFVFKTKQLFTVLLEETETNTSNQPNISHRRLLLSTQQLYALSIISPIPQETGSEKLLFDQGHSISTA